MFMQNDGARKSCRGLLKAGKIQWIQFFFLNSKKICSVILKHPGVFVISITQFNQISLKQVVIKQKKAFFSKSTNLKYSLNKLFFMEL